MVGMEAIWVITMESTTMDLMKATMDHTKDTMRDWSTRMRWTGLQRF